MLREKRKKLVGIFLFLLFLLVVQEAVLLMFDQKDSLIFKFQRKWLYSSTIKEGLEFYTQEKINNLKVDEYLLVREINARSNKLVLPEPREQYLTNPFKRILDKQNYVSDIQFYRKDFTENIGQPINNSYYWLNKPYESYLDGPYDDVMFKSLYCDVTGYTDYDFLALKSLENGEGGYQDTHFLLSLILLRENKCHKRDLVENEIKLAAEKIIKAQEDDKIFSDLYAERVVFLYWAGYGNFVKKDWTDMIQDNLTKDPGWRDKKYFYSDAHVTGLAILSMIYYKEGKSLQSFYPHTKSPAE